MKWTVEYGAILRKKRKTLGKNMEDLADENISTSTISNIEKGFDIVSEEKIKYLCQKLDISFREIPKLLKEEQQKEQLIHDELFFIENLIDLGNIKQGIERLKKLKTDSPDFQSVIEHLKGRALVGKKHIATAQSHFQKSIKLAQQAANNSTNIMTASYNQLAKIAYYENNFELALQLTDEGIKSFDPDGKRQPLIYSLMVNKAIYLEKLDFLDKASSVLQELWKQESEIKHIEVILNMYDVQATIYKKYKMYSKAIAYARSGYEIAHINKNSHRSIELLTNLGSIHLQTKQYEQAEKCFTTALSLKKQIKTKHLFLPIYVQLGKIYINLNKFAQAEKILETAVQDKNNQSNIIRYNQALITLGDCFLQQKQYEKAIAPYTKALLLAQKHALLSQEHVVLRNLCLCWKETDLKQYQKGLHRFFEIDVQLCKGGEDS
jgi:tetratricopeptide (TPR) repeat protein